MKKRADGRYVKVVDGKFFYGYSEREVMRKILEYERKKEKGATFAEVADEWWNLETNNLSPSTVKGYKLALNKVVSHFGKDYISEIRTSDITRFYHALKREGYAKKTVKNHKIIVNRIFHYAVLEGEIQYNVARDAELPRGLPETKRHSATPAEEIKIKHSADVWFLPFMALFTGMRKGELLGLKWGDIDMNERMLYVRRSVWYDSTMPVLKEPKTEAGKRKIPIINVLYTELKKMNVEAKHPERYVFGGEKPMTEKAYRYAYAKFQKQTGIKATAQQLRKSYATLAVGANVPADVLRVIFGHTDISTTLNIYAEVRDERINTAAELLNRTALTEEKAPENPYFQGKK